MALAKRNEVEGKEKVVMHDHGFRERKQRGDAHTSTRATHNIYKGQCTRRSWHNIMQHANEMGTTMQHDH